MTTYTTQGIKAMVLAYIKINPGQHVDTIAHALGLDAIDVRSALLVLGSCQGGHRFVIETTTGTPEYEGEDRDQAVSSLRSLADALAADDSSTEGYCVAYHADGSHCSRAAQSVEIAAL